MTSEEIAGQIHSWMSDTVPLPPEYRVEIAVHHDAALETQYARPFPAQFGKTDRRVIARRFRVTFGVSVPASANVDVEELADAVAGWYDRQASQDRTLGNRVRDVALAVGEFEPVGNSAGATRTMRATAYEVETRNPSG